MLLFPSLLLHILKFKVHGTIAKSLECRCIKKIGDIFKRWITHVN